MDGEEIEAMKLPKMRAGRLDLGGPGAVRIMSRSCQAGSGSQLPHSSQSTLAIEKAEDGLSLADRFYLPIFLMIKIY